MMSKSMKGLVGAVAIALLAAGQAGAVGFDQKAGFLSPPVFQATNLDLVFSLPTGAGFPASTFGRMDWERLSPLDPGDPSALTLDTFTTLNSPTRFDNTHGDTNADGAWDSSEWFTISRLTQTNNVINRFGTPLWTVIARANLSFCADPACTTVLFTDIDNDTPITFHETQNVSGTCTGVPPGNNPHGTQCDDVYQVAFGALAPVLIGNIEFTFRIEPILNALLFQVGDSLFVYTPETAPGTSILDVQMHWREVAVPAPATLALLGLGLSALALVRLRRKTS
jgi:hypothetical protein